jgi:hypothetical protein
MGIIKKSTKATKTTKSTVKAEKVENELIKVRALNTYKELNVRDSELKFIPEEGYEFEISAERFETLNGKNKYGVKFVEKVR